MTIWILDCSNGCTTKVNLSKEREEEMNRFFENGGDSWDYISQHEEEFGINANSSSYMITENDNIYEVNF